MNHARLLGVLLGALGSAWVAPEADAGGILLQEIGAPRNGTAQAGQAAYANDAATAVYNPAGMVRLRERKIMVGLQPILSDIEFDLGPGTTFSGGDGDDQGSLVASVGSFAVWPLNDRVSIGGGLIGLAGGALEPDGDWAGRFFVAETQLVVMALNPAIGVRVTDWLSLGFGASLNYARLDFEIALPRLTAGRDPNLQLEGVDDFEASFNAGILLEPSDRTRIGLTYRSEVDFDLSGKFDFNDLPPVLIARGLTEGDVEAKIPLPHLVRVSLYQKLTDDLALLLDLGWEDWSVMQFTPISGGDGRGVSIPRNWRDTWHYAVGLEWQATPSWLLQAGVGYDTDPTRDRTSTPPDLPVDRQIRYAAGFVYDWSDSVQIGLNYTFVDLGRSTVDITTDFGRLEGHYDDLHTHIVAASVQF